MGLEQSEMGLGQSEMGLRQSDVGLEQFKGEYGQFRNELALGGSEFMCQDLSMGDINDMYRFFIISQPTFRYSL